MDVLLLDNRDSFTWNLAQAFGELGVSVEVVDTDDVDGAELLARAPGLLCIGPGPRGPADLPHLLDIVRAVDGKLPTLGVCLGLQALVLAHGGSVARARAPVHGKRDLITHDRAGLFAGLPSPLWVMRYHSLVAVDVPLRFQVSARDADGQVMALRDDSARIEAVQFHPESIGTSGGLRILQNALENAGLAASPATSRPGGIPRADLDGRRVSLSPLPFG